MTYPSIWPAPALPDDLRAQLQTAVTEPGMERADRTCVSLSVHGRPVSRRAIVLRRLLPPPVPGGAG